MTHLNFDAMLFLAGATSVVVNTTLLVLSIQDYVKRKKLIKKRLEEQRFIHVDSCSQCLATNSRHENIYLWSHGDQP